MFSLTAQDHAFLRSQGIATDGCQQCAHMAEINAELGDCLRRATNRAVKAEVTLRRCLICAAVVVACAVVVAVARWANG